MSYYRFASVVLALVLTACASSPDTPFGEEFEEEAQAAVGNSRLIVRAQLERFAGRSAWDAVEILNRNWLRASRGGGISSGPAYARVAINGIFRGELVELRQVGADDVESMRFFSAVDATTKYGTGFMGGVIEVTTRRR